MRSSLLLWPARGSPPDMSPPRHPRHCMALPEWCAARPATHLGPPRARRPRLAAPPPALPPCSRHRPAAAQRVGGDRRGLMGPRAGPAALQTRAALQGCTSKSSICARRSESSIVPAHTPRRRRRAAGKRPPRAATLGRTVRRQRGSAICTNCCARRAAASRAHTSARRGGSVAQRAAAQGAALSSDSCAAPRPLAKRQLFTNGASSRCVTMMARQGVLPSAA